MKRKAQILEASLRRELSDVTLRAALDEPARLRWIRDQLENYFDRWAAFLAVEPRGSRSAFKGDLFTMVEVACRVYEGEVAKTYSKFRGEAWRNFAAAFGQLRDTGDVALLRDVRERLVAVANDMSASDYLLRLDVQGHLRVREALREWDPIGCGVPPDEYDMYAPELVRILDASLVDSGGGASDARTNMVTYLRNVCVGRMGCTFDPIRTGKIVDGLLAFWPTWKAEVRQAGND